MPKESAVILPKGMTLPRGIDEEKPEEVRRSIRYPDKSLYDDFYYLCNKFKYSLNEILIGYVRQHVEDNKQFLNNKKNKKQ